MLISLPQTCDMFCGQAGFTVETHPVKSQKQMNQCATAQCAWIKDGVSTWLQKQYIIEHILCCQQYLRLQHHRDDSPARPGQEDHHSIFKALASTGIT